MVQKIGLSRVLGQGAACCCIPSSCGGWLIPEPGFGMIDTVVRPLASNDGLSYIDDFSSTFNYATVSGYCGYGCCSAYCLDGVWFKVSRTTAVDINLRQTIYVIIIDSSERYDCRVVTFQPGETSITLQLPDSRSDAHYGSFAPCDIDNGNISPSGCTDGSNCTYPPPQGYSVDAVSVAIFAPAQNSPAKDDFNVLLNLQSGDILAPGPVVYTEVADAYFEVGGAYEGVLPGFSLEILLLDDPSNNQNCGSANYSCSVAITDSGCSGGVSTATYDCCSLEHTCCPEAYAINPTPFLGPGQPSVSLGGGWYTDCAGDGTGLAYGQCASVHNIDTDACDVFLWRVQPASGCCCDIDGVEAGTTTGWWSRCSFSDYDLIHIPAGYTFTVSDPTQDKYHILVWSSELLSSDMIIAPYASVSSCGGPDRLESLYGISYDPGNIFQINIENTEHLGAGVHGIGTLPAYVSLFSTPRYTFCDGTEVVSAEVQISSVVSTNADGGPPDFTAGYCAAQDDCGLSVLNYTPFGDIFITVKPFRFTFDNFAYNDPNPSPGGFGCGVGVDGGCVGDDYSNVAGLPNVSSNQAIVIELYVNEAVFTRTRTVDTDPWPVWGTATTNLPAERSAKYVRDWLTGTYNSAAVTWVGDGDQGDSIYAILQNDPLQQQVAVYAPIGDNIDPATLVDSLVP